VSDSGFSEELDKYFAAEIQSLEHLEILLLLSGNPHKWWTAKGVYDVIKSSLPSVEGRLRDMTERGILKKEVDSETRYQFSPADEGIWRLVSELREAYKERPVKVVQAIYSAKAPDGVQEFARAFRLRKD
jgi:hypothetical protein